MSRSFSVHELMIREASFSFDRLFSPLSFKYCTPAWKFSISHTNTTVYFVCAVSAEDGR